MRGSYTKYQGQNSYCGDKGIYGKRCKNEFCTAVLSGFKVFVKSLSLSGRSLTSVMHFPVLFA